MRKPNDAEKNLDQIMEHRKNGVPIQEIARTLRIPYSTLQRKLFAVEGRKKRGARTDTRERLFILFEKGADNHKASQELSVCVDTVRRYRLRYDEYRKQELKKTQLDNIQDQLNILFEVLKQKGIL